MALAQGADIQKVTANSIVGVINDFNSIVVNQAHSKVQYHSGNVPHLLVQLPEILVLGLILRLYLPISLLLIANLL